MNIRKKILWLLLLSSLVLFTALSCCNATIKEKNDRKDIMDNNTSSAMIPGVSETDNIISYPYLTGMKFQDHIKAGIMHLEIGDAYDKALSVLGVPTRIRFLYDPKDAIRWGKTPGRASPVGFSVAYIFAQKAPTGSVVDKGIEGFLLEFDKNFKLTRISQF